jgi:hypothetical protein
MGVDLADAGREHIHAFLQLLAQIGEFWSSAARAMPVGLPSPNSAR